MSKPISHLQQARAEYQPKLPEVLAAGVANVELKSGKPTQSIADQDEIKKIFENTYGKPIVQFEKGMTTNESQLNVGVILSGGQAPGGHNVIAGIFDALKQINKANKLYGFLGGPSGIINGEYVELTNEIIDEYRNTGGFDIIGSGRTKLETEEQFKKSCEVCQKLGINAVVIIGGDDSNTNAALLAEYFVANECGIQVIGVPKTIDGDLKNTLVETSFGFDTCTKVYAELIGNLMKDALSAKKYWHFVRLMGRSASHIALECSLQTHPNVTIISEEVAEKKMPLKDVVQMIVDAVVTRAESGKNYGILLVPEGLIEFIPEMKDMIAQLNDLLAENQAKVDACQTPSEKISLVKGLLQGTIQETFSSLPASIQAQLLEDRDPHGNVQVSKIETEKLLIEMVAEKLTELKEKGSYKGKFSPVNHFFGYEGRCAFPSNFDADYCYSLGFNAFCLIRAGLTGYMSAISNTTDQAKNWKAGGIPVTCMMNIEKRHGENKPVIQKALVELDGRPFSQLKDNREQWLKEDCYIIPGAIQYWGPSSVCDATTVTLALEQGKKSTCCC